MKSNFLKIVLPAFALMLAITASLAFTSVEEDVNLTSTTWYQDLTQIAPEDHCTVVTQVTCDRDYRPFGFCSYTIEDDTHRLYDKDSNSKCNITLFKLNAE